MSTRPIFPMARECESSLMYCSHGCPIPRSSRMHSSSSHDRNVSSLCRYVKHDDPRYRLARKEGKWTLNEYYVCPHGTDTPPSLGWSATNVKFGDPPQVRCLEPPTHLPLFLKLAVEELCAFGLFEELDQKIREISSCGSIPTLLLLMLDRLENGMEDKLAVRNVFSQIWCSLNGMLASELCELAGIESESSQTWALLFSSVRPFLVERGGRFTFLHNYIRDAVGARFVTHRLCIPRPDVVRSFGICMRQTHTSALCLIGTARQRDIAGQ